MKRGGRWRVMAALHAAAVLCVPTPAISAATGPAQRAIQVQPAASVGSWPGKAKRWALVIGVDKYSDPQITPLRGSSNDAKSIADALVRYAGFPSDQVILLATDQPEERQPTRAVILKRLYNLKQVPTDGLLFVSFAGHGMERNGEAFLLPADVQLSNDVDLLEQTAINVATIKQAIRRTGVRQVVLVLDACRNDPGGRADQDNPLTPAFVRGFNFDVRNREVSAFATLYATAVGERAYEYTEKRQGYFTWELVEGMRGAAANSKGEVTLASLLNYVQQRVPKHVLTDLGPGREQKPFADIGGYQADELVIAIAPPGATPANVAPLQSQAPAANGSLPRVDPAAVELMFWETIKSSSDPEDFKAYLSKYPGGQFADLARRRSQPRQAVATINSTTTASPAVQSAPTRTVTTTTAARNLWSSQVYLLGYYLGYAEVAAFQKATAAQMQQFLESAREVAGQIGYATQPLDQMLAAARGGSDGQSQYQGLLGVRQTLEQQFNVNANCGRQLNLRGLLLLGYQQGFMEVVAYQGGDSGYLTQIAGLATQGAAAASLPTAGFLEVSRQLGAGTASRDQYQPLVNQRAQMLQALALACTL